MIISRTPYRVSFAGGGTDIPEYYRRGYGAVLSTAIDKYAYVTVHQRFDSDIRIASTKLEIVGRAADIRHDLVREALKTAKLEEPLEITTIGDVPAGTGMGSSSTITVGLLKAFHEYAGRTTYPSSLAKEACSIEIDRLQKPIGKQDQYAAAFGGINYIRFNQDDTVEVTTIACKNETIEELERHAIMFHTGGTRSADTILKKQTGVIAKKISVMDEMRDLASEMKDALTNWSHISHFSSLLHRGWELKKSLGCGISDNEIDQMYETAERAGALGGKLLGAGGSGFLLLIAPPKYHNRIRDVLGRPKELPFKMTMGGSRIILRDDERQYRK